MAFEKISPLLIVIVLTLISGFGDAMGFVHAANIWQSGRLVWGELARSALGFAVGISMYWLALKSMTKLGVLSPEMQTVVWFGVTIIGVALVSGNFLRWRFVEQVVAVGVLAGIGWLLLKTSS